MNKSVRILDVTCQKIENPLGGYDVEVGGGLNDIHGFIAYYHFTDFEKNNIHGCRVRWDYKVTPWLSMEAESSYDDWRGANYFIGIDLKWQFGQNIHKLSKLMQKMTQLPVRDVDVITPKVFEETSELFRTGTVINTVEDFLNINNDLNGH